MMVCVWDFCKIQMHLYNLGMCQDFPTGWVVKNPPANAGDGDWIPGLVRSLEKEMAIFSTIFAWEIPWVEKPGELQSMGLQSQTWLSN